MSDTEEDVDPDVLLPKRRLPLLYRLALTSVRRLFGDHHYKVLDLCAPRDLAQFEDETGLAQHVVLRLEHVELDPEFAFVLAEAADLLATFGIVVDDLARLFHFIDRLTIDRSSALRKTEHQQQCA